MTKYMKQRALTFAIAAMPALVLVAEFAGWKVP